MANTKKKADKYVAYVSTYTMDSAGDTYGIRVYDVDTEKGRFTEKAKVEISNSSYISISHNRKYLYSITDFGVEAYYINKDGTLALINHANINGMRGCYLSIDYSDSYLFVAGYHDGKLTILKLEENGAIGEITDEVYHKGLGSVAERNFRPHINCARMTHDNKYLLVADQGMDHINVYKFDTLKGKVKLVDVLRSELESAPRHIKISGDGRFVYIVHTWKCFIDVYSYEEKNGEPYFEKIQTVSTLTDDHVETNAASALSFSEDYKHLLTSNEGDNSVTIYDADPKTGMLEVNLCLPVSGEYPKDAEIFPGNQFLVSLNHASDTMTFFRLDMENHVMIMNGPEMKIAKPNCIIFHKLPA